MLFILILITTCYDRILSLWHVSWFTEMLNSSNIVFIFGFKDMCLLLSNGPLVLLFCFKPYWYSYFKFVDEKILREF
jgi:hypothetical protein